MPSRALSLAVRLIVVEFCPLGILADCDEEQPGGFCRTTTRISPSYVVVFSSTTSTVTPPFVSVRVVLVVRSRSTVTVSGRYEPGTSGTSGRSSVTVNGASSTTTTGSRVSGSSVTRSLFRQRTMRIFCSIGAATGSPFGLPSLSRDWCTASMRAYVAASGASGAAYSTIGIRPCPVQFFGTSTRTPSGRSLELNSTSPPKNRRVTARLTPTPPPRGTVSLCCT